MKRRVAIAIVMVAILLVGTAIPVAARAEKVHFDGVSEAAGPPIANPECKQPDPNLHCRGLVIPVFNTVSDDRLSGPETVTIHTNFRPAEDPEVEWTGPWWGTSQIGEQDDGGYWTAVFTGERDERGFGHLRVVAHGHGEYEGLKAFYTGLRESPEEAAPFVLSGYILEPGGK